MVYQKDEQIRAYFIFGGKWDMPENIKEITHDIRAWRGRYTKMRVRVEDQDGESEYVIKTYNIDELEKSYTKEKGTGNKIKRIRIMELLER